MIENPGALLSALSHAGVGIKFRAEVKTDWPFICALYADTRAEEVAQIAWPPGGAEAFLAQQCTLQAEHYRKHYENAQFLVIEREGAAIGRLYLHETAHELRLMDIALTRERRGQGLGTLIMQALLAYADVRAVPMTLHVEPFNPAHRLYTRLGFQTVEERGIYHLMSRPFPK